MNEKTIPNFGNLTLRQKIMEIKDIITKKPDDLDVLFHNVPFQLKEMSVIEAEKRIALEQLRTLTSTLQTKRLHTNIKNSMKYFTL